jgi:hypothetical protein
VDRPRGYRWAFAVAAVTVASVLSIPLVRHFVRGEVSTATVEIVGDSSYSAGEKILQGSPVRSGISESTVVRLQDGSEIELRAQSEVLLKPARSSDAGVRVRVNSGSALVTASKQRAGQLNMETKDLELSVVGTVFLVEVEPSGTHVGVIEGVVEVRQGESVRMLSAGEQLSTEALRESRRLADSISWSRSSRRLAALLPFPPVVKLAGPSPAEEPPAPRRKVSSLQGPQAETPPAQQAPETPPAQPQPPPPGDAESKKKSDPGSDGPGKETFGRACGLCHSLEIMENAHGLSREAYASLVSRQVSIGAPVSPQDVPELVDYLFRTYGPRNK